MAISNIDKNHLENLMISLNNNENQLEFIKSNHVHYSKLKFIFQQMNSLKNEAVKVIQEAQIQNELFNIKKSFQLVSGTTYYVYEKENKEKYFSLISPEEWNNHKHTFIASYYYDYDKQFILL